MKETKTKHGQHLYVTAP